MQHKFSAVSSRCRRDSLERGNVRLILAFVMGLWVLNVALAQNQDTVTGDWLVTRDAYGNPLYHKMTLHLENGKLTGAFWDDKLEGTLDGDALDFVARDEKDNTSEVTGTLNGNTITGKVVEVDARDPADKAENTMTATRRPERSQLGNAVRLSSPTVL